MCILARSWNSLNDILKDEGGCENGCQSFCMVFLHDTWKVPTLAAQPLYTIYINVLAYMSAVNLDLGSLMLAPSYTCRCHTFGTPAMRHFMRHKSKIRVLVVDPRNFFHATVVEMLFFLDLLYLLHLRIYGWKPFLYSVLLLWARSGRCISWKLEISFITVAAIKS